MEQVDIEFDIISSNDTSLPLSVSVLVNNTEIFNEDIVNKLHTVTHTCELESNSNHEINIVLFGKDDRHTTLNNSGEIITSAHIRIKNIKIQGISVDKLYHGNENFTSYTHDNNGYSTAVTDVFGFFMGCNGTATIKFQTPVYLWLLEFNS